MEKLQRNQLLVRIFSKLISCFISFNLFGVDKQTWVIRIIFNVMTNREIKCLIFTPTLHSATPATVLYVPATHTFNEIKRIIVNYLYTCASCIKKIINVFYSTCIRERGHNLCSNNVYLHNKQARPIRPTQCHNVLSH